MQQYIPGVDSPENKQMADAAESSFKDVLKDDPKNETAIAYLASLYLNEKRYDDANAWYDKLTQVNPKSAVGYYSKGFIAWSKWYPVLNAARAKLKMNPDDPGPIKDKKVKAELKEQYGPLIDAGLRNLDKALEIDPEYDDAMAYENLLIRERADLADSKEQYEKETKVADDWIQKVLATKKLKEEKKAAKSQGGGIVADQAK